MNVLYVAEKSLLSAQQYMLVRRVLSNHEIYSQVKVTDQAVMSNQHMADVARWIANAGRHQHQSILPWIWNVLTDHDLQHAPGERACERWPGIIHMDVIVCASTACWCVYVVPSCCPLLFGISARCFPYGQLSS